MNKWKSAVCIVAALGFDMATVSACDGDDDVDDGNGRDASTTSSSSSGGTSGGSSSGGASSGGASSSGGSSSSGSGSDAAATLSEAQIGGVTSTVNNGEITQGQLAQTKGVSAAAKEFGTEMVTMHTAAQQRQAALMQQLGLTPASSTVSEELETAAAAMTAQLQSATGAAFDRLYLEGQATQHTQVLAVIDDILLPSAQTAALRTELQTSRAEVAMHRDHALMLVDELDADAGN